MDFPVRVLFRKTNKIEQSIIVVNIVIAWDVFSPKPSSNPVKALNSLTLNINRTPSLKFWSLGPIINLIKPAVKNNSYTNKVYEFVGPICESTDKFGSYKKFQKLKENDFIVIFDVGAYGVSLSSNYNLRPKPAEILIKKSKASVISKRQKLIEII